jgi:hypothetical protein
LVIVQRKTLAYAVPFKIARPRSGRIDAHLPLRVFLSLSRERRKPDAADLFCLLSLRERIEVRV